MDCKKNKILKFFDMKNLNSNNIFSLVIFLILIIKSKNIVYLWITYFHFYHNFKYFYKKNDHYKNGINHIVEFFIFLLIILILIIFSKNIANLWMTNSFLGYIFNNFIKKNDHYKNGRNHNVEYLISLLIYLILIINLLHL